MFNRSLKRKVEVARDKEPKLDDRFFQEVQMSRSLKGKVNSARGKRPKLNERVYPSYIS